MKKELTPMERSARNSIIWQLSDIGFNVTSVSNIMNISPSTISRLIDKKPKKVQQLVWFNLQDPE